MIQDRSKRGPITSLLRRPTNGPTATTSQSQAHKQRQNSVSLRHSAPRSQRPPDWGLGTGCAGRSLGQPPGGGGHRQHVRQHSSWMHVCLCVGAGRVRLPGWGRPGSSRQFASWGGTESLVSCEILARKGGDGVLLSHRTKHTFSLSSRRVRQNHNAPCRRHAHHESPSGTRPVPVPRPPPNLLLLAEKQQHHVPTRLAAAVPKPRAMLLP
jgi:hypothetical protein